MSTVPDTTPKNPNVVRLEKLEKLEKLVAEQASRIEALERVIGGLAAVFGGGGADVADDDELDGKYGDPVVKKDPTTNYWKGQSFLNKHLSECSPEYLDAFAKYRDVCAKMKEKDGTEAKKKYAAFDRRDAARARGWARRLRSGWVAPIASGSTPGGMANGSSNPFAGSGANPFAGGSIGFGASRVEAPPPAPPPSSEPMAIDDEEEEPLGDGDDDISFNFGANAKAKAQDEQEEEELPLV